jgi:hypothetical protein
MSCCKFWSNENQVRKGFSMGRIFPNPFSEVSIVQVPKPEKSTR